MAMTMQKIMSLPVMEHARVVTARRRLATQNVDWVSVIEMPVENFVRENEFVLTTAVGCGKDPRLFFEFVRDVFASGAAALGVALGRHVYDIPGEIRDFAEENDFILVEIPWEVRFSDITRTVLEWIHEERQMEMKRSEYVQQELIDYILRGKGPREIAGYIWRSLRCPVVICDSKMTIQGASPKAARIVQKWPGWIEKGAIPLPESVDDNSEPQKNYEEAEWDEFNILQMKILTSGKHSGYLYLFCSDKEQRISAYSLTMLEHAVTACALWFLRENAIVETEQRLEDDLIWSLATGDYPSWEKIRSRAGLLGYQLELPYVCVLGFPENLDILYDEKRESKNLSKKQWMDSMLYYIQDEILYASETLEREAMVTFQHGRVVIFLEHSESRYDVVHHFLDFVERRFSRILPGVIVSWGIGKHQGGQRAFQKSYEKAKTALEMGRFQAGPGGRVAYEDTKMNRLLFRLSTDEEVCEIVDQTLRPLLEYDKKREMDLVGTFQAYNRHKANVSKTARALRLHRQSLLYRLRKIESLTGLSLVEADDLFLLDLCIRIWSLQRLKEG